LVGLAPEEQCKRLTHGFSHPLSHRFVPVPERPTAVLESTRGVLLRAAGSLHHAVERDECRNHELAHLILLPSRRSGQLTEMTAAKPSAGPAVARFGSRATPTRTKRAQAACH